MIFLLPKNISDKGSLAMSIPKPVMRALHIQSIKKNLAVAAILATAASTTMYFLVNKPRKEAYANFYATYDAEKDYERMKVRPGLLLVQCCGMFPVA